MELRTALRRAAGAPPPPAQWSDASGARARTPSPSPSTASVKSTSTSPASYTGEAQDRYLLRQALRDLRAQSEEREARLTAWSSPRDHLRSGQESLGARLEEFRSGSLAERRPWPLSPSSRTSTGRPSYSSKSPSAGIPSESSGKCEASDPRPRSLEELRCGSFKVIPHKEVRGLDAYLEELRWGSLTERRPPPSPSMVSTACTSTAWSPSARASIFNASFAVKRSDDHEVGDPPSIPRSFEELRCGSYTPKVMQRNEQEVKSLDTFLEELRWGNLAERHPPPKERRHPQGELQSSSTLCTGPPIY